MRATICVEHHVSYIKTHFVHNIEYLSLLRLRTTYYFISLIIKPHSTKTIHELDHQKNRNRIRVKHTASNAMSSRSYLRDSEHNSHRTSYVGGGIYPAYVSPVKY